MDFEFHSEELKELYVTGKCSRRYDVSIVKAFFKRISLIAAAKNENDLRKIKSNHFEKLKGYNDQYSMRLNDKMRLIFYIRKSESGNLLSILDIKDYH